MEEKIIHLKNAVLEVKNICWMELKLVGKKGEYRTLYIISLICITKVVGPHVVFLLYFQISQEDFKTLIYVCILSNWAWQLL